MKPRHVKAIALLILIGAIPFSAGVIFHSTVLTWTGYAVIGLAILWFLISFSAEVWSGVLAIRRAGKPRVVVVWSKWAADEYERRGWTLRPESTRPRNGAMSYLLQWLREGDPVVVDWRKFPERKAEAFPRMKCVDAAWVVEGNTPGGEKRSGSNDAR